MNFMLGSMAAEQPDSTEKTEGRQTRANVWNQAVQAMIDPTGGMDEPQRADYEQKIMQKLKSGRRLTSEELDYLRIHNPEMYKIATRVETERKVLKAKLSSCKSKEEVRQVIWEQMEVLKTMKGDPAQEYMIAMVDKEVQDFKKTGEYARLPEKLEKGKKKADGEKLEFEENDDDDTGETGVIIQKAVMYSIMQVQCNRIGEMAQTYLSA